LETSTAKIRKRLEQEAWHLARNGANHDIYRHDEKGLFATIPRHQTVSPDVARQIAKVAGWDEHGDGS
jgi:predicted RNA binding protein YcfA (HicA-like mRNA interferase family)